MGVFHGRVPVLPTLTGAPPNLEAGWDYSFTPSSPTVKAGPVTITAPNDGQILHELVVFKTDKSAGSLPQRGSRGR